MSFQEKFKFQDTFVSGVGLGSKVAPVVFELTEVFFFIHALLFFSFPLCDSLHI